MIPFTLFFLQEVILNGKWKLDRRQFELRAGNVNGRLAEIHSLSAPRRSPLRAVFECHREHQRWIKSCGVCTVGCFQMGWSRPAAALPMMKKPEVAFKCFIRFMLAQAAVSWGMELMTGAFRVAQGMVTIMDSSG